MGNMPGPEKKPNGDQHVYSYRLMLVHHLRLMPRRRLQPLAQETRQEVMAKKSGNPNQKEVNTLTSSKESAKASAAAAATSQLLTLRQLKKGK
jgi:hypothetical protein